MSLPSVFHDSQSSVSTHWTLRLAPSVSHPPVDCTSVFILHLDIDTSLPSVSRHLASTSPSILYPSLFQHVSMASHSLSSSIHPQFILHLPIPHLPSYVKNYTESPAHPKHSCLC